MPKPESLRIGMVGMGKLGAPVALAIESRGHRVLAYDVNPAVEGYFADRRYPHKEAGLPELLADSQIEFARDLGELVAGSELIFLPVQTPHGPQFEGSTRLPEQRADFDYSYLKQAVGDIALTAAELQKPVTLAVISTCLPGTFERDIRPLLNQHLDYVYTPQFVAMGNVIDDYLNPEFNLIGIDSQPAAELMERFYATINQAPNLKTDITTAEAIKVVYNTFITMKTVMGNAVGEFAHKVGANFDDIFTSWELSTKRLLSSAYLRAGVGDGGGCHPRDNIAMSHIAKNRGISHNLWEDLMAAREDHMDWLARLSISLATRDRQDIVILGKSFKPETEIETGSPAILLKNIVDDYGYPAEQYEDLEQLKPALYVIGTNHARYQQYRFPPGSTVVDPFRTIPDHQGVKVIRIGENKHESDNSQPPAAAL